MGINEELTTAYAQYLILTNFGQCVPQKTIEIINDTSFKVNADNGEFYFSYENGKCKAIEK